MSIGKAYINPLKGLVFTFLPFSLLKREDPSLHPYRKNSTVLTCQDLRKGVIGQTNARYLRSR